AEENIVARWLTQYQVPSYRTICRFRISDEIETLLDDSLTNLTSVLKQNGLIDEVSFIDGTKILADANKFSFVWKKNTIRFDDMNKSQIQNLLS
ncbi:DDE transposase, partial [Vibrio vulnificus]